MSFPTATNLQVDNLNGCNDVDLNRDCINNITPPTMDSSLYENITESGIDADIYEAVSIGSIPTADLIEFTKIEDMGEFFANNLPIALKQPSAEHDYDFPNLIEHDKCGFNFELNLNPPNHGTKNNWYYSATLLKVFIKLEKKFFIEVEYLQKTNEQLYLRAMMVYLDDLTSSVNRCNNHLCADKTASEIEKNSVIRCFNSVQYFGTADGKHLKDRISLLIPLQNTANEENIVKQSIALKFVCQNSCIGRRQTAVIFTLETKDSQVLGKKVVNIKVCSCPKRDKQAEENKFVLKRKAEQSELELQPGKRLMKIKEEPETDNSSDLSIPRENEKSNIISTPAEWKNVSYKSNGKIDQFYIELPNMECARTVAETAFGLVAGAMSKYPSHAESLGKYLKHLKKLLGE